LRPAARVFPLALTWGLVLLSSPASAQGIFAGMQKGLETVFSSVSTTTTFASGEVTKTETNNIYPALTLNFDTLIYPSLKLNAGGVFEINFLDLDTNGSQTSSTISRNRPYIQLRSTNPTLAPGVSYFRREERARTTGLTDVKLVNEEYGAYLGWQPEGGPRSDLQFLRTHTFDGARAFQDVTKGFGSLISTYTRGNLGANYRGSYLDTDNQLQRLETRQVSHAGRVSYSDSFISKRLLWNASYNVNYQDLRTAAHGTGGEVALPVNPSAGLATLSDTPVTAKLSGNQFLIDGNLAAGAGIDLGLPTPPADQQSRNIGLDLLNPTEVNRFLIWVDRDLPFEIANSFSWEVYSSSDNIVWKRESIVGAAPFGPFENRFEIDFPGVTARYVKVVTRPLSAVVQDSSRFPDILVTEMQAFLRRRAGEVSSRLSHTTQILNTDVRMRLLDTPSLYYEGFYVYDGPNLAGSSTDTLSNGLSLNQTFGRIFSAYARGAREQGRQQDGYRTATVTNATLTVDPVSTLRSSFLYAGLDERIAGLPRTRRGFFVQNSAQLYQGIDFLFGFGWNATTRETGEIANDRLLNASATIVPRERVSLTFNYDDTTTERSGTFVGSPRSHIRRLYAAVAVDPFRTLHVALGEEVIAVSDQRTRTTFDVNVNFSPFPDGALQFMFASNDALRALEFGKDRSTLGAVRWNISRQSYVDVSYQRTRSEFVFQTTESKIFSVTVRLFF
jgi:hypothetical protein